MTLLKRELSENERAVNLAFNDAVVSPGKGGLTPGKKAVLFKKTIKKLFTFPHFHQPDAAGNTEAPKQRGNKSLLLLFLKKKALLAVVTTSW